MALQIRDPETDALVRELAALRGVEPLEAVRAAVQEGLARERRRKCLLNQLRPLLDRIEQLPQLNDRFDAVPNGRTPGKGKH